MVCSYLSDKGLIRTNNEDYILVNEDLGLYIIADGMGGHNAGEVASKEACKFINSWISNKFEENRDDSFYGDLISSAINLANKHVYELSEKSELMQGMGCTVVVLFVYNGKYHIHHVGDSRAYLLREGHLSLITTDHTLVQDMVKKGNLSEEEDLYNELRHIITQSLGSKVALNIDEVVMEEQKGDYILLSTDGLHDYVDTEYIQTLIENETIDEAVKKMIDKANENGGKDNCSIVLLKL